MVSQAASPVPPPPQPLPGAAEAAKKRRKRRPQVEAATPKAAVLLEVGEVTPVATSNVHGLGGAGKVRNMSDGPQMDWMVQKFKTMPCTVQMSASSHDHRCCPYYHSERDRRRPVFVGEALQYTSEPCENRFDDARSCAMGDACNKCHSTAELLYHPTLFKKRLCHQLRRCPRSKYCAFAHARQELLVPNFSEEEENNPTEEFIAHRFKTQWCPIGGPHDWESCVYAHTYRDWRRVPLLNYSSHPCPRWSGSITKGSSELDYGMRCPLGIACPLAHGAKEQLYHPQFYKTSPCSDPNCRRGPLCAFTHGEEDMPRNQNDNNAKVARKPIPQAHLILAQHQPTWASPPMYHALEDAPKVGGAKSRKQRGRSNKDKLTDAGAAEPDRLTMPQANDWVPEPELPAAQQPSLTLPPYGAYGHEVFAYTAPYPPYMWLPLSSHGPLSGSPHGPLSGSPAHSMPENQMFWGGCSPLSPGCSPLSSASGSAVQPNFPCVLMPDAKQAEANKLGGGEVTQEVVNLSAWRQQVGKASQQIKDLDTLSNGWRTLSSFGSLPGSVGQSAPSTPRSPRSVEQTESTKSGSGGSAGADPLSYQGTLLTTGQPVRIQTRSNEPVYFPGDQLALEAR
eukprot:TRINITY_DN6461_c0_g1_i1.p1 TRINITY_DN6461_c0_g1~~TRINITY_DN6461_c0_g1_i1.p1  ORF type:complete len:622 (+),score=99.29 TRINITY_DN6461_c0_g1_i1:58-1923(+)